MFEISYFLLLFSLFVDLINGQQPEFNRNIPNLSIIEGKDAIIRCSVSNLGENKILWTHVDSQQLISIQEHMIVDKNGRISIQIVGDTFELRINNISLEDRGYYMCSIQCLDTNTQCIPKSQVGYLNIVVPPRFDETVLHSESNVTVREFEDVNISCSASGNPKPSIYWKREDVYLNEHNVRGNKLHIISANRQDAGVYICIASNGVQPSISRRINLIVHFAPMIRIVTQVLPAYISDTVKLECQTESNPLADHFWLAPNGDHISSSSYISNSHKKRHRLHNNRQFDRNQTNRKYQVRLKRTIQFKYLFQLHINNVNQDDAGTYVCQLRNPLGETQSAIQLKVNERLQPKKASKEITRITTKTVEYDLDNDVHKISTVYRPEIKIRKNEEDNHISNQRTQLLKAKKSSSTSITKLNFYLLIVISYLAISL